MYLGPIGSNNGNKVTRSSVVSTRVIYITGSTTTTPSYWLVGLHSSQRLVPSTSQQSPMPLMLPRLLMQLRWSMQLRQQMRLRQMPLLSEAMRPLTLQVQDDSRKTQALTLVLGGTREAQERLKIPAPQPILLLPMVH